MLKKKAEKIRDKNWREKMANITVHYKEDPQKFWAEIKKQKGNNTQGPQRLESNNKIVIQDEDKEILFREMRIEILKIKEEESRNYDRETE